MPRRNNGVLNPIRRSGSAPAALARLSKWLNAMKRYVSPKEGLNQLDLYYPGTTGNLLLLFLLLLRFFSLCLLLLLLLLKIETNCEWWVSNKGSNPLNYPFNCNATFNCNAVVRGRVGLIFNSVNHLINCIEFTQVADLIAMPWHCN